MSLDFSLGPKLRVKVILRPSFQRLIFLFCGLHISISVNLYLVFARQSAGKEASIHHCVHSCSATVMEMIDKIVRKARTCQMLSYLPASKLKYLHLCSPCSVLTGGALYLCHTSQPAVSHPSVSSCQFSQRKGLILLTIVAAL